MQRVSLGGQERPLLDDLLSVGDASDMQQFTESSQTVLLHMLHITARSRGWLMPCSTDIDKIGTLQTPPCGSCVSRRG